MPKSKKKSISRIITEAQNPDNKLTRKNLLKQVVAGHSLVKFHCFAADLNQQECEAKYTVSDALVNLLHYAHSMGFDAPSLVKDALDTYLMERGIVPLSGGHHNG